VGDARYCWHRCYCWAERCIDCASYWFVGLGFIFPSPISKWVYVDHSEDIYALDCGLLYSNDEKIRQELKRRCPDEQGIDDMEFGTIAEFGFTIF
jgi:hypothetical protein